MATAGDVLQGVQFNNLHSHVPEEAELNRALGFLVLGGITAHNIGPFVAVLGFGVPGWQRGTDALPVHANSITHLQGIPPDYRTIARQGKGVGIRMYNTPQALGGTAENPERIGAYVFTIDPQQVYDARRSSDRTLAGKARRDWLYHQLAQTAEVNGINAAVDLVHGMIGDVDVALYNQTPDREHRQKRCRQPQSVIHEAFMVIRNPAITLIKAGEYRRC